MPVTLADLLGGPSQGFVASDEDLAPPAPAQEATPEEPGIGSQIWDAGASILSGIGTALDTLARPVRTGLHTHDIRQAAASIFDPSQASSTEDLLRDVGYQTTPAGDDRSWGTAIADTGMNLLAGALTDPVTYLSFGTTAVGEQALSKGATAVNLLRQGKRAEALAQVGGQAERLAAGGVMPRLSQRLAAGESALKVAGIPVLGERIAPVVRGLESLGDIAGAAIEGTAGPRVHGWMQAIGNFFRESTGKRGMDILAQQAAAKGFNFAEDAARHIGHELQRLRDLGVREEDMRFLTDLVQTHSSVEHLNKVALATGKSAADVEAIRAGRLALDPNRVYQELRANGYNREQIDAMASAADAISHKYRELANIEKELGMKEVVDLGTGALGNLEEKRGRVIEYLRENGVPPQAIYDERGNVRDLAKVFERDKRLAQGVGGDLLKDYELATEIAAQMPGYTPMRISRDAATKLLEVAKNDPGMMRKMSDITGVVSTSREAEQLIQTLGAAATGGRTISGKLSPSDMGRAFFKGFDKSGLDGAAKELAEAVAKGGKMFEEHPGVVFADRLQVTAKALGQDDYIRGIRGMLGQDMPPAVVDLRKQVADAETELRVLRENRTSPQGVLFENTPEGPVPIGGREGSYRPGFVDTTTAKRISDAEFELQRLKDKLEKAQTRAGGNIPVNWERASSVWAHLKDTDKDFLLPAEVLEVITRQKQMMADPRVYGAITAGIREFSSNWKALTLASPSTIMRNKIGNLFLRATHGGLDGISAMEEPSLLKLSSIVNKAAPDMAEQAAQISFDVGGGRRMNGWEVFQKARELGAIDSGMWATEFHDPISEGLKSAGGVKKITAPFKSVAQTVENGDKLGHFLARLRAGDSPEQAAWSASQALFNYRVVSPAVQMLRSTGLGPFAAWQAKNIPAQMSLLIHKPGYFAAMLHAKNAIEQGVPGYSEEELPAYVRDKFNVAYRRNKDGSVDFITGEGVIPMADLPKIANPADFFSEVLGPLPKTGMEWLTNKDLFTKRNIKEFDNQVKPLFGLDVPVSPMTEKVLENLVPRATTIVAGIQGLRGTYQGPTLDLPGVGAVPRGPASLFLPAVPYTSVGSKQAMLNERALLTQIAQAQKEAREMQNTNPRIAAYYQQQVERLRNRLDRLRGKGHREVP